MKIGHMVKHHPEKGLVLLTFIAFIALGMPDGLLGVAWPSIRTTFAIPLDAIGLLLVAGMVGYLTASTLSGAVVSRLGVGKLLAASCGLTGAGLISYALAPAWWMMVLLGVVAGLGAGAIDAGINAYAAAQLSERLMQWLHASYGIGVTLGPMIMTISLTALQAWQPGYLLVGGVQLCLAVCFSLTLSMWKQSKPSSRDQQAMRLTDYQTRLCDTLLQPRVWLSVLLFFFYVGAEVTLGTWAYTLLVESRGVQPQLAGVCAGGYWAAFTVGRIAAGLYAQRLGVHWMVRSSLIAAVLGSGLLWWNPLSDLSLVSIAFIGLAIAPIFAALMSGTRGRVGDPHAANTIGMQMAAGSLGAAIIPALVGAIARRTTLEVIPLCLLALYAGLLVLSGLAGRLPLRRQANDVS